MSMTPCFFVISSISIRVSLCPFSSSRRIIPNFGTKLFNTFNLYSFRCTKIGTEGGSRTHTPEDTGLSDQRVYRSATSVQIRWLGASRSLRVPFPLELGGIRTRVRSTPKRFCPSPSLGKLILGARPLATHPRFSRGLSLVRLLRETW